MEERKFTHSTTWSDDEIIGISPYGEIHLKQGVHRTNWNDWAMFDPQTMDEHLNVYEYKQKRWKETLEKLGLDSDNTLSEE